MKDIELWSMYRFHVTPKHTSMWYYDMNNLFISHTDEMVKVQLNDTTQYLLVLTFRSLVQYHGP